MTDDLQILITGSLDTALTTAEIQKQLKQLQGNFKVSLGVDTNAINNISKDIESLQNQINDHSKKIKIIDDDAVSEKAEERISSLSKEIEKLQKQLSDRSKKIKVIDEKDVIDNSNKIQNSTKQIFTSAEKAVEEYSKLGQVRINSNLNPLTKEIEGFTLSVKKADDQIEKLKFNMVGLQTGDGVEKAFELSNVKNVDDRQKNAERVMQQELSIQRALDEQNRKLEHQLSLYKQQAQINVKKLERQYNEKDIDKNATDAYLASVKDLNVNTPNLKQNMDNLDMSFKNIKESVSAATSHTLSFSDQLKIAISRTLIWSTAMTGLYGSLRLLQNSVDVLYTLDEQLISIAKVVDGADLGKVFDNATQSAYQFGRTIDGALASIEEIAKLGFSSSEASKLSENSLLLSTIGDMEDADAANYLVAIMRQYQMEISETSKVVDSLNELSNKTGASTIDLAQSLSKASSSASVANISFDELNAMSASIVETLRISGSEAGNFLKTLSSHLVRESTIDKLESLGITVRGVNGDLLSGTDILRNTASAWDNFSSMQQNSIAQSLGGVYHINKVTALLGQQSQILDYTAMSTDAYGSGLRELETFQEGLAYKTNVLKASMQELVMTMADDGGGRTFLVTCLLYTSPSPRD